MPRQIEKKKKKKGEEGRGEEEREGAVLTRCHLFAGSLARSAACSHREGF